MEKKCEVRGCKSESIGWIRTKRVCARHFRKFKKDNIQRIKREIDITPDFTTIWDLKN